MRSDRLVMPSGLIPTDEMTSSGMVLASLVSGRPEVIIASYYRRCRCHSSTGDSGAMILGVSSAICYAAVVDTTKTSLVISNQSTLGWTVRNSTGIPTGSGELEPGRGWT